MCSLQYQQTRLGLHRPTARSAAFLWKGGKGETGEEIHGKVSSLSA